MRRGFITLVTSKKVGALKNRLKRCENTFSSFLAELYQQSVFLSHQCPEAGQ